MQFEKRKKFFVGVDSDGTVFDSMKIKHRECFIPAAVQIWEFHGETANAFQRLEEKINLASVNRGVNRFPGLLMVFEALEKETGEKMDGIHTEALKQYLSAGYPLSNAGLEQYLEKNPSKFLAQVLKWSQRSDCLFTEKVSQLQPFAKVKKCLKYMHEWADLMAVSAASTKGLEEDWSRTGLVEEVNFIAGQEFGSKEQQLLFAQEAGYEPTQMLMIGDAPGDYAAARAVGCCFYPIIPGREEACWEQLQEVYFAYFINGRYGDTMEEKLYAAFFNVLSGG